MADLILTWPNNCDYPVFRRLMKDYRKNFGKVFVVFTEANDTINREAFVQQAMIKDDISFLKSSVSKDQDWRNVAINLALGVSKSDYVLFLEQDFLIHNPKKFFNNVAKHKFDVLGFYESERLHPGFMLVKREVLNKTRLNFAANPPLYDHFGMITRDLANNGIKIKRLREVGIRENGDWYHMAGLSHNLRLLRSGEPVTYKPKMFMSYLRSCSQTKLPLPADFFELFEKMKEQLK